MFSGIVEEIGIIKSAERCLGGTRISILAETILENLNLGESVSVSGACLTVAHIGKSDFSIDVSGETLNTTNIGGLAPGSAVNLERAMKLNDRISGHLVTGHVDGIGMLRERKQEGNAILLMFEIPGNILRYCIQKGSVTIDGVSLTINDVSERGLSVAVIPHTAKVTTLGMKQPGDSVNIESDLVGKYVDRLIQNNGTSSSSITPTIDRDYLEKHGLI